MQATDSHLTIEQVNQAVEAILEALGQPTNEVQLASLQAFRSGNHQHVKRLAATNLQDYFCKSLGYLGGALKLTPNTDTILAESARAASDHVKEITLRSLSDKIHQALN